MQPIDCLLDIIHCVWPSDSYKMATLFQNFAEVHVVCMI